MAYNKINIIISNEETIEKYIFHNNCNCFNLQYVQNSTVLISSFRKFGINKGSYSFEHFQ